jgi:hypothetical protein
MLTVGDKIADLSSWAPAPPVVSGLSQMKLFAVGST